MIRLLLCLVTLMCAGIAPAAETMRSQAPPDVAKLIVDLGAKNVETRKAAAVELVRAGRLAVPGLMRQLIDNGSSEQLEQILVKIGRPAIPLILEQVKTKKSPARIPAVRLLGLIGGEGRAGIPAVVECLEEKDQSLRSEAVKTLTRFGDESVPALIKGLQSRNPMLRENCARVLTSLGPLSAPALAQLTTMAGDRDEEKFTRFWAVAALAEMGPAAEPAVPTLAAALDSLPTEHQFIAARALGNLGPGASDAVPALMALIKKRRGAYTMELAIEALAKIGPASVPPLVQCFRENNPAMQETAAAALVFIGKPAVPALIGLLYESDPNVRGVAVGMLARIGEPAVEDVLISLREKDRWVVRFESARVLAQIPPAAKLSLPALVEALNSENVHLRVMAADAIAAIGPEASEAVPHLINALRVTREFKETNKIPEEDWQVYLRRVAGTLGKIGEPAVPTLVASLGDKQKLVRDTAAFALLQIRPRNTAVVPALVDALQSDNTETQKYAMWALKQMAPQAATLSESGVSALPGLLVLLGDDDKDLRTNAAIGLAMLGAPAIPALIESLSDKSYQRRAGAVLALYALGPMSSKASPHLIQALKIRDLVAKNPDVEPEFWREYVRLVAGALARIGAKAVPDLIEALEENDPVVKLWIIAAVGQNGSAARKAVAPLVKVLGSKEPPLRQAAIEALGQIGAGANDAVPKLIEILGNDKETMQMRVAVVRTLYSIGSVPEQFAPQLLKALTIPDKKFADENISDTTRDAFFGTITSSLVGMQKAALPQLIESLDSDNPKLRTYAAIALKKIDPDEKDLVGLSPEAVAALVSTLKDQDRTVRSMATDVLSKVGESATSGLISALQEQDPAVRAAAAKALGGMGPADENAIPAPNVIPALKKALKDKDERVRASAKQSFKWIDPRAAKEAGIE